MASFGDTKAEALSILAEALTLHESGGEPIDDPDAFLEEIDIEINRDREIKTPPWETTK